MSSNTCLFCLGPEGTKDIFHKHYHEGKNEMYSELLLKTYNVNVPQDIRNSKICEHCATELRAAAEFKVKVIKSINYLASADLKVENDDCDDFDDKISVEFDEEPQPVENTGQIYVIKLNSKNSFYDDNKTSVADDTEVVGFNEDDEIDETSLAQETSLLKERTDKGYPSSAQQNLKQPESQNHKDLKDNSLTLVFNSNLCLFKSLKTKFGCFVCKEAFLNINDLRQHSKIHSNAEAIKAKFNRLRGMSYQNADISNLECIKCGAACLDLTGLKKHLIENHEIKFGDAEHFLIPYKLEDSFECVLCSEKFNTYMRLSIHMNNHYSNNVCEICGNSYINRMSLRIHLQTRHREKKCSLCSDTFLTSYARVRHMRTHHNSSMSKRYCLICGKTFLYTYQLIEHKILEHGAKRQLSKCSLCPKTFPNTQNLKIHIRSVHVRERNFPCHACEMRFFTKFDQKRHERTHLDEKSYVCGICESKFKGKDSLRRHLKRQHGHT
ncbi:zinc finger protein 454-like [Cydia amplana]|uniref:zinc finger protein 454-like n=1 Tax=Cydia amplana TaxID=1869771 RepID=UPI002FE51C41